MTKEATWEWRLQGGVGAMAPTVRSHVTPTGVALVAKSHNTPCHTTARDGVDVES